MALDGIVMSVRTPSGKRYVSSYTGVSRAPGGGVELTEYVRGTPLPHVGTDSGATVHWRGAANGRA